MDNPGSPPEKVMTKSSVDGVERNKGLYTVAINAAKNLSDQLKGKSIDLRLVAVHCAHREADSLASSIIAK